jgi:L-lactate dehydrogenase complex protein LldG
MQLATAAALWERFAAKAGALGAAVQHAATEAAAAELVAGATPTTVGTRSLAEQFPGVAAACAPAGGPDSPAPEVVAGSLFAVAETGSVLVCEPNRDRGACLLAERLWLLVREDRIVPTVDVAFERLAGLIREGAPHAILMTGPSRSADIERTLTVGVHGPRELMIVVVGGEAA